MQKRAMAKDFSWRESGRQYAVLYESLIEGDIEGARKKLDAYATGQTMKVAEEAAKKAARHAAERAEMAEKVMADVKKSDLKNDVPEIEIPEPKADDKPKAETYKIEEKPVNEPKPKKKATKSAQIHASETPSNLDIAKAAILEQTGKITRRERKLNKKLAKMQLRAQKLQEKRLAKYAKKEAKRAIAAARKKNKIKKKK